MTVEEQLISALAEVERLRKAVVGKDAEISHKDALLSLKDAEISQKNAEIKKLSDTLLWLRRKVFGKMSEKNLPLDLDQLLLFEQEHLTDEERARQTFPSGLTPAVKDGFGLHGHYAFDSVAKEKSGVGLTTDLIHWLQAGKTMDVVRIASKFHRLASTFRTAAGRLPANAGHRAAIVNLRILS